MHLCRENKTSVNILVVIQTIMKTIKLLLKIEHFLDPDGLVF